MHKGGRSPSGRPRYTSADARQHPVQEFAVQPQGETSYSHQGATTADTLVILHCWLVRHRYAPGSVKAHSVIRSVIASKVLMVRLQGLKMPWVESIHIFHLLPLPLRSPICRYSTYSMLLAYFVYMFSFTFPHNKQNKRFNQDCPCYYMKSAIFPFFIQL